MPLNRLGWQVIKDEVVRACLAVSALPENQNKWIAGYWSTGEYTDGSDASKPMVAIFMTHKEAKQHLEYRTAKTIIRNGRVR